jgi:hypothetical protein
LKGWASEFWGRGKIGGRRAKMETHKAVKRRQELSDGTMQGMAKTRAYPKATLKKLKRRLMNDDEVKSKGLGRCGASCLAL